MWKSSKNDFFVQIKTKGFFVGESLPERFFLVGNRNVMRTILHRSAMLVVVGYAHLSWILEFERFLFQLKIFMWKSSTNDFFVQIKTKGFFGESIPERFWKGMRTSWNGMRSILGKPLGKDVCNADRGLAWLAQNQRKNHGANTSHPQKSPETQPCQTSSYITLTYPGKVSASFIFHV